jgi:hypothetical protein
MYVEEKNIRKEAYRLLNYFRAKGLSSFSICESPELLKWLWAVPIPIFIATILIINAANLPESVEASLVFEPAYLLLILNVLFLSLAPFVVAYICAKGYVDTGSARLFIIGCGMLGFGLANLAAGLVQMPCNAVVTIHNTGAVFSGLLQTMLGVLVSVGNPWRITSDSRPKSALTLSLLLGYAGVVDFVGLVTIVTLMGVTPVFFAQGVGPTLLRQAVLGTATLLFAFGSIALMRRCLKSHETILYWYSLGLALVAVGLSAVFLQEEVGDPIGWVGRLSQYLGGVYFMVAVLVSGVHHK